MWGVGFGAEGVPLRSFGLKGVSAFWASGVWILCILCDVGFGSWRLGSLGSLGFGVGLQLVWSGTGQR